MRFRTSIEAQKGTRREPCVGDVFTFHVPNRGWLFGRVAAINCQGMPGCTLVYIYRGVHATTTPVPVLDKQHLLIPPRFVFSHVWRQGYFVTVQKGPLRPGDLFEKHCFDNTFGRYVDEHWNNIDIPFEPCGHTGIDGASSFDDDISDALGIPRIPEDQKRLPPTPGRGGRRDAPGEVALHIPARIGQRRLDRVEEHVRAAVQDAGAGEWEGHGFDLDTQIFDTRFVGKSTRKLLEAIRDAACRLKTPLPSGCYIIVRRENSDTEERLDL
jgi:hypothetical protein